MRVALYTRVSTQDQNCELQLRELRDYALRQGWDIAHSYQDVVSGAKACRPGLDRLMADAHGRKFECVLCWKLDRFGRSLVHLVNSIHALESCGVRFIAITQGLDTDQQNPTSRFLLHVLGAAAELERSLIAERTHAGRMRYREDFDRGKVGKTVHSRSGKDLAPHRPRKVFDREEVARLHREGLSMRTIARRLRVGLGTVSRSIAARSKSTRIEGDGPALKRVELSEQELGPPPRPQSLNFRNGGPGDGSEL